MRLPVASSVSLEPARQRQAWIDDRPSTELGLLSRSQGSSAPFFYANIAPCISASSRKVLSCVEYYNILWIFGVFLMKYIHFEASGMLAGLAAMLECFGFDTEDEQVALGMDAPWLFLREDGNFIAGQGLYTPRWLNLYLLPSGFRLMETCLPKEDVPAFLRMHHPAMLPVNIDHRIHHPVVCTAYENSRYIFSNVKTEFSPEPDQLTLSRPMLLRRLKDQVSVLTLERCQPEAVDLVPLLAASLETLADYERDIMNACAQTVTRKELNALRTPMLRGLMVDMLPMALLLRQTTFYHELRQLNHDYRHIFTRNSPETVELRERLPRSSIRNCLAWMRENIVDRLYEHGLTDEQVESILAQVQGQHN